METTTLKKMLKIICIICMVVYAALAAVGVLIATNTIPPEAYADALGVASLLQGSDTALYITTIGVSVVVSYAIRFLFTIPVLRGIKNPSKMKLGIVLYAILTALILVNVISAAMRGGDISTTSAQLFVDVFILGCAVDLYRRKG